MIKRSNKCGPDFFACFGLDSLADEGFSVVSRVDAALASAPEPSKEVVGYRGQKRAGRNPNSLRRSIWHEKYWVPSFRSSTEYMKASIVRLENEGGVKDKDDVSGEDDMTVVLPKTGGSLAELGQLLIGTRRPNKMCPRDRILKLSAAATFVLAWTQSAEAAKLEVAAPTSAGAVSAPFDAFSTKDGSIELVVAGGRNRAVEIYSKSAVSVVRSQKSCQLRLRKDRATLVAANVTTACRALFEVHGSSKEFVVSFAGSTDYSTFRIVVPPAHPNSEAKIVIERPKGSHFLGWPWKVPKSILVDSEFGKAYYFAGAWQEVQVSGPTIAFSPKDRAFLGTYLAPGSSKTKLRLYTRVIDAIHGREPVMRGFDVEVVKKAEPKAPKKPKPPALAELCDDALEREPFIATGWFYFVCVDARSDGGRSFLPRAVQCKSPAELAGVPAIVDETETSTSPAAEGDACAPAPHQDPGLLAHGNRLLVNRRFVVVVFHPKEATKVDVGMDGYGFSTSTYVPAGLEGIGLESTESATASEPTFSTSRFERPPVVGGTRILTVSYKMPGKVKDSTVPASMTATYLVEELYDSAWRLGLAASWAPLARKYGVRTGDAGAYAAVLDGDGGLQGTAKVELFVGHTWYLEDRREFDRNFHMGFYFGLGVLELGNDAVKPLSSVMVGLDMAVGHDFSVVVGGGMRRYDRLPGDVAVGQAVPAGTILDTAVGLSPTIAIMINFSPALLKAAGAVSKLYEGKI